MAAGSRFLMGRLGSAPRERDARREHGGRRGARHEARMSVHHVERVGHEDLSRTVILASRPSAVTGSRYPIAIEICG